MGRLICLLALPFIIYGFGLEWLSLILGFRFTTAWRYFGAGTLLFACVWFVYRSRMKFFMTLEHELTHTIAGLICFKSPTNLAVEENGGHVVLTGTNWFIKLAPYFLPTVPYCVLGLAFIASPSYHLWLIALLGASMAWHVVSTLNELHPAQPDLQTAGPIFSLLMIPAGNLILVGGIVAYVSGTFSEYWLGAFAQTASSLSFLVGSAKNLIFSLL